jgi:hypothetical protein
MCVGAMVDHLRSGVAELEKGVGDIELACEGLGPEREST